ncbi:membrane protein insertion efficiency factor YidD [Hasllibacter sp. MH4015]|uniref:membrane protein insertion efficiency factor YidD n=1 Tax=Hasllibacter sp. MH4015 TaxID=2854029 RepID=UPI001CD56E1A|nr:membrane protein insertion efficiency factor YidD [Hasllibacter sp. MH4015]
MVSQIALGAIWGYQRWISPRKGWRCAHSVLHGGTGCSGYAKHAIRDHGIWGAIPLIRQRFRDCRDASVTLRAACTVHANWAEDQAGGGSPRRGSKRRRKQEKQSGGWFGNACDCGDAAFCGIALPAFCVAGSVGSARAQGAGNVADKSGTPVDGGGAAPDGSGAADGCGGLDCSAPSCDGGCGGCDCAPSCG